jgi:4-hydroxy-tetrahydrodipicolinate synthase
MWKGVMPAVTTKFTPDGALDHAEMERCFALQMQAGCDGIIVAGSLGEGPMLRQEERVAVLKTAQSVAAGKPVLMTVCEGATWAACEMAAKAARAGASGLMIVPSPIYHTNPEETEANLRAIAAAGDLPVMLSSNRVASRVEVTVEIMERLADDPRCVAVKESSDAIRRSTEIINRLGTRYDLFTGVDNRAFEALAIYRWFRPLLDLDVSTYLVQHTKLAEVHAIGSDDGVRAPRRSLSGSRRAEVEGLIRAALAPRPALPDLALAA